MTRCKERSGVLFEHACEEEAARKCGLCSKPICERHRRKLDGAAICIACAREHLKGRKDRGVLAGRFQDDPHFFYYFHDSGSGSEDDPYDAADYALFDDSGADVPDFDGGEPGWEGS